MRSLLMLVAVFAAAGVVAGAASAGGGKAVPASTVTFGGGDYSATFVRSASGIVNEVNRVNLVGGAQNGLTSLDVWLQFRPLNGTPNPACDTSSPSFLTSFTNWANDPSETDLVPYFGTGQYNVCVYLVHSYAVDLSVAPNPVVRGNDVVFTSHLLVDGTASTTPPATIDVHAYGTDSTCTTEAGYGPFPTTQSGADYTTAPLIANAAPGDYYYKAEATFATPTLTRWSGCTKLTIQPVVTVDLAASPNPVVVDNTVVFTSHVKFDGVADTTTPAADVTVHAFGTNSTCTTEAGYGPFGTSVSGSGYVTAAQPVSLVGTYYYKTTAITAYGTFKSGCLALVINPHVYTLSLLGNGVSPLAVAPGGEVTYSGQALLDGSPLAGVPVTLTIWTGLGCSGSPLAPGVSAGSTDVSGDYSLYAGAAGTDLLFSLQAFTADATSACLNVTEGDNWSLTLLITPSSLTSGSNVTLSGTLSNTGVTTVAGQTVTIVGYGTDNTCTTAVWGPWTPTTDSGGNYTTGPLGTSAAPGDYYYKATSMGVASGCEHFTITP